MIPHQKKLLAKKIYQGKSLRINKLNYVLQVSENINENSPSYSLDIKHENYLLSEFLYLQTQKACNCDSEVSSSIELLDKNKDNEDNLNSIFYNVKTLLAKWEDNDNSFIHVFVNTTAIKKYEMEKSRNEVMQLMFSSVSHEFRTPINAFTNSISFIESNYNLFLHKINDSTLLNFKDDILPQKIKDANDKFFKIWKISATSLMSLVEDILDIAKIQAGTFSLNNQTFIIDTLIKDIEFMFDFQWNQKGIAFNIDVSDELKQSSFWSDIGRIKQVLINLISNAYKFTMNGRITLHVSLDHIFDDNLFEREKFLKFIVHDTGVGINEKDISKLFTLFGTIKWYQNLNSRGTGLGLAISKKIVESLGGTIKIKIINYLSWKYFYINI